MESKLTVTLNEQEANALLAYLATRPYQETFQLIDVLKSKVVVKKEEDEDGAKTS